MDMAQWQDRLEQTFTYGEHVGGRLFEIFNKEKECNEFFAITFHGQSVLIDSLQSFFIETLKAARQWIVHSGWPPDCPAYEFIYICYLVIFRRIRACETLFIKGYPFDGYALLRGLKDQAIVLAGIAHNYTTLSKVWGASEGQEFKEEKDFKHVTDLRKKEESKVWRLLLRKESRLPDKVIRELNIWERMFHEEVHGFKFSITADVTRWRSDQSEPSIGPTPPDLNNRSWFFYMNRAAEIGWLIVRLLPYLQPVEKAFGEEWAQRQDILDDSFRYVLEDRSKQSQDISEAFLHFVDSKFSFRQPFYYFEADGSGA